MRQTSMHRTVLRRGFEAVALFGGWRNWEIDLHRDPPDSASRLGDHFFCHMRFAAFEFDADSLGDDGHCGENAGAQGSCDQIGWRKRLAFAEVIGRSVG